LAGETQRGKTLSALAEDLWLLSGPAIKSKGTTARGGLVLHSSNFAAPDKLPNDPDRIGAILMALPKVMPLEMEGAC